MAAGVEVDMLSRVRRRNVMRDIKVDEALWASSMLPEGVVERWFIASGAAISTGERIAEVRIEDALHEIIAPASGRATIVAAVNAVIEPGSILATVDDTPRQA
jgi:pyruvate/2-oxoglutarate dehydrogenase complex dihydrolipoamide acyltransferase (E2) component